MTIELLAPKVKEEDVDLFSDALDELLRRQPGIRRKDLSIRGDPDDYVMEALSRVSQESLQMITGIYLTNLSSKRLVQFFKALTPKKLRLGLSLSIDDGINVEVAKAMSEFLMQNEVDRLDLSNCFINPTIVKHLGPGLNRSEILILSGNPLGDLGVLFLVEELTETAGYRRLEDLNLESVGGSLETLIEAMENEELPYLKSLNVMGNKLSQKRVKRLVKASIGHPKLRDLRVGNGYGLSIQL